MAADGYLEEAIAGLIEPTAFLLAQGENEAGIRCLATVEESALITALRSAVAGGIGGHAGGASDPTTRMPINADALRIHDDIEVTVAAWFMSLAFEPPHLLPEENLRAWHAKYLSWRRRVEEDEADEAEATCIRLLRRWAREIRELFDPPIKIEVKAVRQVPVRRQNGEPITYANGRPRTRAETVPLPCPRCGESIAFDPRSGNMTTALVVSYRQSQAETALADAVGTCLFCESTWLGDRGIRRMRYEIEQWEFAQQMAPPDGG